MKHLLVILLTLGLGLAPFAPPAACRPGRPACPSRATTCCPGKAMPRQGCRGSERAAPVDCQSRMAARAACSPVRAAVPPSAGADQPAPIAQAAALLPAPAFPPSTGSARPLGIAGGRLFNSGPPVYLLDCSLLN